MKARRYSSALNVLATGLLVLLVTLLVLFWARWGCESARHGLLPRQAWSLSVDASSLIMPRTVQEPNGIPCTVHAEMAWEEIDVAALGATQYQESHRLDAPDSPVYAWSTDETGVRLYYDRSLGMVVYSCTVGESKPDGTVLLKKTIAYAGPEGIADRPDKKVGRFRDPVVRLIAGNLDRPIVYDRVLRRFFAIDGPGKTVKQGPPWPANFAGPVDFGWPRKQPRYLSVYLDTPEAHGMDADRALVLDATGYIQMLDLNTLEYVGSVGRLPAPDSLFASVRRVAPDDLFAFEVMPVFLGRGDLYAGCAVAVLSRDATSMKLEVFDPNGIRVAMQQTGFSDHVPMGSGRSGQLSMVRALYFKLPGAAALTATKFILESLHPPVLLWLSYFTASRVEATAGHRSLFVLPNSFAAMKGRDAESWWLGRFVGALPFLLPGVVVGIVLSRLVGSDARRKGLPTRTRRLWMAATVLFTLPAYVTYQITRPTTARVTCQNCGRDRWVDRETCHHCGSPWLVSELIPPTWRVIGQPEEQTCNDPSPRPEETISNT